MNTSILSAICRPFYCLPKIALTEQNCERKKPRLLCLHGVRTSGEILRKQLEVWPDVIQRKFDLVFVDGPFPSGGNSTIIEKFPPPYFEWFQLNKEYTDFENIDKGLSYIEELMIKHGPFDGIMGFSQGAVMTAIIPGFQQQGLAFTKVPEIKFVIIVSGGRSGLNKYAEKGFTTKILVPSLHITGERDWIKPFSIKCIESYEEPTVIYHKYGHIIPRLDQRMEKIMLNFIERIQISSSTSQKQQTA